MSYTSVRDALNPIATWRCDDASGDLTDAVGSLDIPLYISGQGYSQTSLVPSLAGASTSVQVGSAGNGWYYSGAMAGIEGDDVFGMDLWINSPDDWTATPGCIWWKSEAVATANYYIIQAVRVTATTAKLAVYWGLSSGSVVLSCISDAACLTKATNHHIVISRANSAGILFWVDGQRITATMGTTAPDVNGTPTTVSTSLTRVTIGMGYTAQNKMPNLRVDEISVYGTPLTTEDAQSLYNAGAGTAAPTYAAVIDADDVIPTITTRLRANADPLPFLLCDDSNGNWINDPSNAGTNYGRIGGIYHGLRSLGYPWHGTVPLMPGGDFGGSVFSEVAQQHASLPWDVTMNQAYGANTGAPAGADAFWDVNGAGSTETGTAAYNYMMPYRYRYDLADGSLGPAGLPDSAAWLSNGRVWPGAVTIRSTAPIAGHNLRGTYWYVEGPYTGDTPGSIKPTARQTADVKTVSSVSLSAVGYDAVSTTLDLDSSEYSSSANVIFNWGANGAGTVTGSLVTLALRVESRDVAGGFEVGPLFYVGGGTLRNAKNALANIADASLTWWFEALFSNQTTPMAVIEIDLAVNNETTATHQNIVADTTAMITRIRAMAVAAGADSDNILFILKNSHPVKQTGNEIEDAFIKETFWDYQEVATAAGNCVVVGMHLIKTYDEYVANGWNHTGDTDNHHLLVPTGYDGEAEALMAVLGLPLYQVGTYTGIRGPRRYHGQVRKGQGF